MKPLLISIIFIYSSVSFGLVPKIEEFSGKWKLSKGKKHVCPKNLIIKTIGKGKVEVSNIRVGATGKKIFKNNKTIKGKSKHRYIKKKMPHIKHDYTLVTHFTSSFINGRLVSSHLWIIPEIADGTSTATKTFSITDKDTLVLEKVLTGYGKSNSDPSVDKEHPETVFAKHENDYTLGTMAARCVLNKVN